MIRQEILLYDERKFDKNVVHICGKILQDWEKSHEQLDRSYLKTIVAVERVNGSYDNILIVVDAEYVLEYIGTSPVGQYIEVFGRLCSFLKIKGPVAENITYVYASSIYVTSDEKELSAPLGTNFVELQGYLSRNAYQRVTKSGKTVTEILVRSCRNQKEDYISAIAWGSKSYAIAKCKAGVILSIYGRVQSLKYYKNPGEITEKEEDIDTIYKVLILSYKVIGFISKDIS